MLNKSEDVIAKIPKMVDSTNVIIGTVFSVIFDRERNWRKKIPSKIIPHTGCYVVSYGAVGKGEHYFCDEAAHGPANIITWSAKCH